MKSTVLGLVGTIGAIAFAFVSAELLARWWLLKKGRSYALKPNTRLRMHLDTDALPTLAPVVEHLINSQGERGDEPPSDQTGLFRVLVVGGSAAECWYIDQNSTWPHVIQDQLKLPANLAKLSASHIHVGSIARSLVSCRQVDAILERVLPSYGVLDAIVLMVGTSDILQWLESGAPDRITEAPIPPASIFTQFPDGPFGWAQPELALRRVLSAAYWRCVPGFEEKKFVGRRIGEARQIRKMDRHAALDIPNPKPMLDGLDKWFRSILRQSSAKARSVVVVHQPWIEKEFTAEENDLLWSYSMGSPYKGDVSGYYSRKAVWELHRIVNQHIADISQEMGVVTVDLIQVLEPTFDNYYDDHHFTPRGCRVIGEVVASAILTAEKSK